MLAKFLGSDTLFCFISMREFESFKNPFAIITDLSEFHVRCRKSVLLIHTKKVVSMSYCNKTIYWKPWRWMKLDLIFTMRDLLTNSNLDPLTKFSSSHRSTEFKDILPCNICQIIKKPIPIHTRTVTSWAMKGVIPFWVWNKVSWN